MSRQTLLSGLAALGIYLGILTALAWYLGAFDRSKPQHFVEKKGLQAIDVTLAGATPPKSPAATPRKARPSRPKSRSHKPRNTAKPKASPRPKSSRKAPSKPKAKPSAKKLFGKVKLPAKPKAASRPAVSATRPGKSRTIKKPSRSDGIEHAYLARIERLLKGWPAQVNYAGEKISVFLKVYPSGRFEFKVLELSGNPQFNQELIAYLKQLQRIGFGPHKRQKPYEIKVSFVARE